MLIIVTPSSDATQGHEMCNLVDVLRYSESSGSIGRPQLPSVIPYKRDDSCRHASRAAQYKPIGLTSAISSTALRYEDVHPDDP